ncbi:hypothetical protein V6N13_033210 [Hibiscus sabdariffa]
MTRAQCVNTPVPATNHTEDGDLGVSTTGQDVMQATPEPGNSSGSTTVYGGDEPTMDQGVTNEGSSREEIQVAGQRGQETGSQDVEVVVSVSNNQNQEDVMPTAGWLSQLGRGNGF